MVRLIVQMIRGILIAFFFSLCQLALDYSVTQSTTQYDDSNTIVWHSTVYCIELDIFLEVLDFIHLDSWRIWGRMYTVYKLGSRTFAYIYISSCTHRLFIV